MKLIKRLSACRTCSVQSAEDMEKKLFPRFCIGHIAFIAMGIILVFAEWSGV